MGPAPHLLLLLRVQLPQPKTTRGWQSTSAHHINYAIIFILVVYADCLGIWIRLETRLQNEIAESIN